MPRRLANAVLFQAGWFACLFAADQPLLLLVAPAILALHFLCIGSWAEDGRVVIAVALLGSLLDCLLLNLGLFDFGHGGRLIPPWLALLWALLGTTLNHCLAWTARPCGSPPCWAPSPGPCRTWLALAWRGRPAVRHPAQPAGAGPDLGGAAAVVAPAGQATETPRAGQLIGRPRAGRLCRRLRAHEFLAHPLRQLPATPLSPAPPAPPAAASWR